MKASGSGRMPGNFSSAASTSSVAASPSGSSPARERLGLLPPLAAGDVGDQLEQHVGRGAERDAVGQNLAQACGRRSGSRPARRCAAITASTSAGSLRRKDAEAVADGVIEAASRRDRTRYARSLLRARLVEPRARDERRLDRMVARCGRRRPSAQRAAAAPSAAGAFAVGRRRRAEFRDRAS